VDWTWFFFLKNTCEIFCFKTNSTKQCLFQLFNFTYSDSMRDTLTSCIDSCCFRWQFYFILYFCSMFHTNDLNGVCYYCSTLTWSDSLKSTGILDGHLLSYKIQNSRMLGVKNRSLCRGKNVKICSWRPIAQVDAQSISYYKLYPQRPGIHCTSILFIVQ
jgi:hypothetical protein